METFISPRSSMDAYRSSVQNRVWIVRNLWDLNCGTRHRRVRISEKEGSHEPSNSYFNRVAVTGDHLCPRPGEKVEPVADARRTARLARLLDELHLHTAGATAECREGVLHKRRSARTRKEGRDGRNGENCSWNSSVVPL